jgi:hypothetical protein
VVMAVTMRVPLVTMRRMVVRPVVVTFVIVVCVFCCHLVSVTRFQPASCARISSMIVL